jgi:hypothetical protein
MKLGPPESLPDLNDLCDIEPKLDALRAEVATLVNLPVLSPEFTIWLGKLFQLVEGAYGAASDEMRQLRALSPELPSEFYDSVTERLGSLGLDDRSVSQLYAKLYREIPAAIFKRRLYEYDDLIAAFILGLRSKH